MNHRRPWGSIARATFGSATTPGSSAPSTRRGHRCSSTGFGSANAGEAYGLAIDGNDNVWLTLAEYASHNGSKGSIEELVGRHVGVRPGHADDLHG